MSTPATIVGLLTAVMALMLATRSLRSHGLSFENKAWMAVTWIIIIAVVAFIAQRFAG